jgi:hypothetical protein
MADDGGLYTGTALANKTFYGFRLDPATGNCDFEKINDGTPVVLPNDGVIDPNDYRAFFWSSDTIKVQWGPNGHIQMVFV